MTRSFLIVYNLNNNLFFNFIWTHEKLFIFLAFIFFRTDFKKRFVYTKLISNFQKISRISKKNYCLNYWSYIKKWRRKDIKRCDSYANQKGRSRYTEKECTNIVNSQTSRSRYRYKESNIKRCYIYV